MLWIVIEIIGVFCVLLMVASNELERRYNRMHPPDDGLREERFDDEQP